MFGSKLLAPLFSNPTVAAELSDRRTIATMLRVEAALARVQGRLGVIPADAAEKIVAGVQTFRVDWEKLQAGTDRAGIPVIEFVRQLREHIGGEAASYIHWGATSQDIMDTALVLQLRAALETMKASLARLARGLVSLAKSHRQTLMAGRTHGQFALPLTFGLKAAGWLAPLVRHRQRLREMEPRLLVLQFGGAVGTLASLGEAGLKVRAALAEELGLELPLMTWHTQRDALVELAGWLSLVSGGCAKMAQDIILMAQSEVGEVRETGDPQRGGSSTMPQKNNPVISETIIAAARTNAALLASMHQALVQEHERATHGWHMEWLALPQMLTLTAAALNKTVMLSENLVVDAAQMRRNVESSHGLMLSEALDLALAPVIGRERAKVLVKVAGKTAVEQGRHLVDVVREQTNADLDWEALRDEAAYLGAADAIIDHVIQEAEKEYGGT